MSRIEWQETLAYQVPDGLIQDFCRANHLAIEARSGASGILVFVKREALEQLSDFLLQDVSREHGGVLLGHPYYDPGEQRYFVDVQFSIAARETEGSRVHLQYTTEAWAGISGAIDQDYPDLVIVGWYHSHPGLGVFMSSTDKATQKAIYSHPWSLAVVADPIAGRTGWFAGAECVPLDRDQVITYEEPVEEDIRAVPASSMSDQEDVSSRHTTRPPRSPWLLPVVGFALAVAVGRILSLRHRASAPGNHREEHR